MTGKAVSIIFVGGGPRTLSLVERIAANASELLQGTTIALHIVDPFPAGGGRIWRRRQSRLLWMNSMAKDVTIFPDDSVVFDGPVVPGPTLAEWVAGPGRDILIRSGLSRDADQFRPDRFASRELQSLYLSWAFDRVVRSLPSTVSVQTHAQRAVSVTDVERPHSSCREHAIGKDAPGAAGQRVELADGTLLAADVVVLAQGYLDRSPTAEEAALSAAAAEAGLVYLPPGYTADIELGDLRPGSTVLVRGFGLAFIDLMVLLFEGSGGRFAESAGGELEYTPSGWEPTLFVGSRRGVPYHAKLGYDSGTGVPVAPVFFTPEVLDDLTRSAVQGDFRAAVRPLLAKELAHAHYRRLFEAHTDRTAMPWEVFADVLATTDVDSAAFRALVEQAVPDPADRFDLGVIDRPLRHNSFADRNDLDAFVADYVRADMDRRADPRHSPDEAVFTALLSVYGVLAGAVVAGRINAADRIRYVEDEFHSLFSFLASGPPPRRLAELLALHRAGLVHFAGPELRVGVSNGRFVGRSPAVPGIIEADALVDARLPRPDVRAASDPVIAGLLAAGALAAEDVIADDGTALGGGQLLADADCRAVRADFTVHERRFLVGPSVSGSAGSAGFARPGFNGAGFRQNDRVARHLLRLAVATAGKQRSRGPLKSHRSCRRNARHEHCRTPSTPSTFIPERTGARPVMPVEFLGIAGTNNASEVSSRSGGSLDLDYTKRLARAHEDNGWDRILFAYHSGSPDPAPVAAFVAGHTERINLVLAQRPNVSAPTYAAKTFATLDHISNGRFEVHFITGGSTADQAAEGDHLDKDSRYDRTREYMQIIKQAWTSTERFDFDGTYYQIKDFVSDIFPVQQPRPRISFGGSSPAAYAVGAAESDIYALWGEPLAGTAQQIASIDEAAAAAGKPRPILQVAFRPIIAPTEELAWQKAEQILGRIKDHAAGLPTFRRQGAPENAGSQRLLAAVSAGERHDRALWTAPTGLTGAGGNSTALVGTPETVAAALLDYYDLGVRILSARGYDILDDAIDFGRYVIPLVRDEVARRDARSAAA